MSASKNHTNARQLTMERATKFYDNIEDFRKAQIILYNYQTTHNIIRNDYLELLRLTESLTENQNQFNSLYRACLRELFSLIESDLYGLNQLDSYSNYRDQDKFLQKFKKTFERISQTWNKGELQQSYFNSKFDNLVRIKKERDSATHPKKPEDLKPVTKNEFDVLKGVFKDYDEFINGMMNGFFIGMKNYPLSQS